MGREKLTTSALSTRSYLGGRSCLWIPRFMSQLFWARKCLAWKALKDVSNIWSPNLSRDLKPVRVFQPMTESVSPYAAARGGQSPSGEHILSCSLVSLNPFGETELPTLNRTATFQQFVRQDWIPRAWYCRSLPPSPWITSKPAFL